MRRRVETRFRESGKTAAAPLAARGSRFVGPFALPLNGWLVAEADGISLVARPRGHGERWEEGFRFRLKRGRMAQATIHIRIILNIPS